MDRKLCLLLLILSTIIMGMAVGEHNEDDEEINYKYPNDILA